MSFVFLPHSNNLPDFSTAQVYPSFDRSWAKKNFNLFFLAYERNAGRFWREWGPNFAFSQRIWENPRKSASTTFSVDRPADVDILGLLPFAWYLGPSNPPLISRNRKVCDGHVNKTAQRPGFWPKSPPRSALLSPSNWRLASKLIRHGFLGWKKATTVWGKFTWAIDTSRIERTHLNFGRRYGHQSNATAKKDCFWKRRDHTCHS